MDESNTKNKNKNPLVPILCIITTACVVFSALQTVYILKLASGSVGNMTYNERRTEESTVQAREESDPPVSPIANPEFSLEHVASVTDPNKPTLSTTEIVTRVSPATVSVYVMTQIDGVTTPRYTGTGFFVSGDGYLVTNRHVVDSVLDEDGYSLLVVVPGYEIPIEAQVVGADIQTDIAVLKAEEQDEPYPYVTLGNSDALQVGELVVAIGNPLGRLEGTVTVGVVSALDREINNNGYTMDLIQTDASINNGNSGGPLINSFGEVIGVTNAKVSSTLAEGLGFAIPISDVEDIIQSIINYGYVANRPYLGITVGQIASNDYYGAVAGVYISEVDAGGPAEAAGILPGDIVVSLDGVAINYSDDIIDVRDQHLPGDEITVVVERNGHEVELNLVIGDSHDAE